MFISAVHKVSLRYTRVHSPLDFLPVQATPGHQIESPGPRSLFPSGIHLTHGICSVCAGPRLPSHPPPKPLGTHTPVLCAVSLSALQIRPSRSFSRFHPHALIAKSVTITPNSALSGRCGHVKTPGNQKAVHRERRLRKLFEQNARRSDEWRLRWGKLLLPRFAQKPWASSRNLEETWRLCGHQVPG